MLSASTISYKSNHSEGSTKKPSRCRGISAVVVVRVAFVGCLAVVAGVLGYSACSFLTRSDEAELAETQFDSIADRALDTAQETTLRKRLGTVTMASIASYANPDAREWPNVVISGYKDIATNIIATSSGRELGFCPLVKPGDEQVAFEEFAYEHFEEAFPGTNTGVSSFGEGIYEIDPGLNSADNRYHDTNGSTSYGSPNNITAPILHHNNGTHPAIMLNLHWQKTRGEVIDAMIECARERAEKDDVSIECLFITDMLILSNQETEPGPGGLIMQPIYPANNETLMVGLIASSIVWGEVLENVFADGVSGVDCVLETKNQVYTYSVTDGVPSVKGEGDLHDRSFEKYRRSRVLTSLDGETLFSDMSAVYTLTLLYPTKKLFNVYSTTNPAVATAGAVLIVMFTSFVFLLYDLFVRKAFNEKDSALNAKRQFMCFVSHEVRTPLNSVCMGLKFMQEEIEDGAPPDTPGGALVPSSNDSHTNEARQDPGMTGQQVQEMKKLIEEILGNAESAVDVLNDFLNYDKIEMGKLSLELTIIPIWTLVEKTMLEFNIAAESKSINFKLDLSRLMDLPHQVDASTLPRDVQECRVVGDAIRITQVLRNIISNGLKFTPEGGSLTITVSMVACTSSSKKTGAKQPEQKFISNDDEEVSFEERGVVRIDVKDTGAGLSVEQSKKLFMDGVRFNVNKLQAGKGSGLGLYIAKGIAEQHGGTLKASSEGLGMGTTFTLLIPLFHIPDMALPVCFKHLRLERTKSECALKLEEGNHEHKIESLRILVVDDSVSNRK